jgi:ribosomal protein S18 acetylase RimI-like enzyme
MANTLLDIDSVKSQMMALWSDTFGDSDDYINLVFDAYFNPDLVKYYTHQGSIVAAMMGIPFSMQINDRVVSALYLCGLATRPEFRRQGIMSEMIGEMHDHAKRMGFDYSFLIPADDHLRKYYEKFGYQTLSHRYCSRLRIESLNDVNVIESKIQLKFVFKNNGDEVVSELRKNKSAEIFAQKDLESKSGAPQKNIAEVENLEKYLCKNYATVANVGVDTKNSDCGQKNHYESSKNAIFTRIARIARIEYFEKCIGFSKILHSRENLKICLLENKISGGEVLISGERSFMVLMPFFDKSNTSGTNTSGTNISGTNASVSDASVLNTSESNTSESNFVPDSDSKSGSAVEKSVAPDCGANGESTFADTASAAIVKNVAVLLWYAESDMELIDLMTQAQLRFPGCSGYLFFSYLPSQLSMLGRLEVISADSSPISAVSKPISIPYGMILPINMPKARENASLALLPTQEVYLSLMLD